MRNLSGENRYSAKVLLPTGVVGHLNFRLLDIDRRLPMKYLGMSILLAGIVTLSACGSKPEKSASAPGAAPSAEVSPSQPASQPPASVTQPTTTPAAPPAAQAPPEPAKPPEPKKYVVAAGTPISVRTVSDVNSKAAKSGSEFEATLESPLVVDGHTLAKRGATVVGRVVNADQGGRVKGKASLTLALSRLHLASGQNVTIHTNSVSQEAKSGTGKNLKRTGIASGAGAAIGAIAGGGKGAAIGAGIGAGAGVATNVATRGPAADIPPETLLNFSLTKDVVVTEKR